MRDIARSAVLFGRSLQIAFLIILFHRGFSRGCNSSIWSLRFLNEAPSSGCVKPTLPQRTPRPLREAKFAVISGSDEAHQNCFRRTNRRGPGDPGLGAEASLFQNGGLMSGVPNKGEWTTTHIKRIGSLFCGRWPIPRPGKCRPTTVEPFSRQNPADRASDFHVLALSTRISTRPNGRSSSR